MTSDHGHSAAPDDANGMDDFEVVAERRRVMATLAALTDQYRARQAHDDMESDRAAGKLERARSALNP